MLDRIKHGIITFSTRNGGMMTVTWVLGIDVGQRKTGLAIGQSLTGLAKPLALLKIPANQLNISHFQPYIKEWKVNEIIIGLPHLADGKAHPLQTEIERIAHMLSTEFALPIHFVDEMLSSHEARQRFGKRDEYDSAAAAVMVESYFAENSYRI